MDVVLWRETRRVLRHDANTLAGLEADMLVLTRWASVLELPSTVDRGWRSR